ncbi:hypothetical protein EOD23_32165 [Mesorhizobium sp. USDA-HM6]|nr:hypothetical protein EOD23_32165 [Mesorhizobium sp. USDA-HM6]
MLKRTLTSGLVAVFVAIGALAATVETSSAHGNHHHHHHHKHHKKPWWWWHHNHGHGKVIILL